MLEIVLLLITLRMLYCTLTRLWMREAAQIMRAEGFWHDADSGQKLVRRERVIHNPIGWGPACITFGTHWVAKVRDEWGTSYSIPRSSASVRRQIHRTLPTGSTYPQDLVVLGSKG